MDHENLKTNGAVPLSDEEVEKVSGGSFFDRGQTWSSDPPHYLIVTALYSCDGFFHEDGSGGRGSGCSNCLYSHYSFPTLYCHARTYDNDPYA